MEKEGAFESLLFNVLDHYTLFFVIFPAYTLGNVNKCCLSVWYTACMKNFVIIDGNALIHRSYHALPKTLRNAEGQLTNAVHGFTGILLGILETEEPDYIATAWDMKGPTFRHEQMAEYKATRAKTDDELIAQFPLVYGVLEALSIPVFKKPGLEADDYLGIVSRIVEKEHSDIKVLIITSDQDALQLVSDRVEVVAPIKGYSEVKRYDREAVKKKLGVWPEQVTDYKGLRGDSSDNIPGVPGIGPKGAVKLIEEYGSIEGIYEHIDEVKPERVRELLKEHEPGARMSKEVATILREDSLDFDLEACQTHRFNIDAVRQVFAQLSFRSHMKRVETLNHNLMQKIVWEQQASLFE